MFIEDGALKAIGDKLGRFINQTKQKKTYILVPKFVEVNMEKGLPNALEINMDDWNHHQVVDYGQLPFKCYSKGPKESFSLEIVFKTNQ